MEDAPEVLHIVASFNRGGTETNALTLVRSLRSLERFRNSMIVVRPAHGNIREELLAEVGEDVSCIGTGYINKLIGFFKLSANISRSDTKFVVIHFFNLNAALFALAAKIGGAQKVISIAGNPVAANRSVLFKTRLALTVHRIMRVPIVSMSRWIMESLSEQQALPYGSVVIHNGCDVDTIAERAAAARLSRQDSDIFKIGMVARLDAIKDQATLIRAFCQFLALSNGGRAELVIVGDGPFRTDLMSLVAEEGCVGNVKFLGARNDVAECLGALDLFVFSTTKDEGFGIVLIEALAAGLPIVASDVPACAEVLRQGELGQLVPPGDVAALRDTLQSQFSEWKKGGGSNSINAAKLHYGSGTMAEHYLAVLRG